MEAWSTSTCGAHSLTKGARTTHRNRWLGHDGALERTDAMEFWKNGSEGEQNKRVSSDRVKIIFI
jgi:hypothetical protein